MLHIILVILKIAGILLAAILLLLLLLLLVLLFVPIRYEVKARHTEHETFVRGKVSWLLHLCTARADYQYPGEPKILVKVLMHPLMQMPAPEDGGKKGIMKGKVKKEEHAKPYTPEETKSHTEEEPKTHTEQSAGIHVKDAEAHTSAEDISSGKHTNSSQIEDVSQHDNYFVETETDASAKRPSIQERTDTEAQNDFESDEEDEIPWTGRVFSKISGIFHRILTFFRGLYSTIQSVIQRLLGIRDKIQRLHKSVSNLKVKIDHYLEIWNEKETRDFIEALFGYIKYLFHHIRPRKVKGYLKYGFSDPSLTGQITGALYVIRPLAFAGLELDPVFDTEALILEGDLYLKGHIRLVHIVYIGLKLIFDKNLKHLRKRLKE